MNVYQIAGHTFSLDFPNEYLHPNFEDFMIIDDSAIEYTFSLHIDDNNPPSALPGIDINHPLIRSYYTTIYSIEHGYLMMYPTVPNLLCNIINIDDQSSHIYISTKTHACSQSSCTRCSDRNGCSSQQSSDIPNQSNSITLINYIFFAVRDAYFLFIQKHNVITIHSSSIIYRDKAYLFSAPSQTGKTTHTNMWVAEYDVPILDGDVAAICIEDGVPIAYGLPWCGTSNNYLNRRVELGGVIFLKQFKSNELQPLSLFDAIIKLSARILSPTWTGEQMNRNFNITSSIVSLIKCAELKCLPNKEAMELVRMYIEGEDT